MKKILTLALLLALSSGLYAQKIKVVSGKLDFLKSEKVLDIQFTSDNTKVGKEIEADYVARKSAEAETKEKGKGQLWADNWAANKEERYASKFVEFFNKYMNGKRLS